MTDIFGERQAAARAVRADVEAIFGAAPPVGDRGKSNVRSLRGQVTNRPARAAGIGAIVAVGLVGFAVGALLTREAPDPREAIASAPVAAPARTLAALEVVVAQPAPIKPLVIEPAPVTPQKTKAAAPSRKASDDCARPGGRRCSYSTVMAADAALRKAYRRAIRAGVSRQELATYRRSWSRLRPAGARDPDRVVRGYRGMAADLNRLARQRRA